MRNLIYSIQGTGIRNAFTESGLALSAIERIRHKIIERHYFLSAHAEEELADDDFDRSDAEHAILKGFIEKKMTRDARGTRYLIEGPAHDGRILHSVCRFSDLGPLIIITAYEKE